MLLGVLLRLLFQALAALLRPLATRYPLVAKAGAGLQWAWTVFWLLLLGFILFFGLGYFVLWRDLLQGGPWWEWLLIGAAVAVALLLEARALFSPTWLGQAEFEEVPEITGIACRANKRLSERIFAELRRIGVTREDSPDAYVKVVGEIGLGTFVTWWSSPNRIGFRTPAGPAVGFTGGGRYDGMSWSGPQDVALAALSGLRDGAGAEFWEAFPPAESPEGAVQPVALDDKAG